MTKGNSRSFNVSSDNLELLDRLLAEEGIEDSRPERIHRRADSNECPLSFAQQRLWFLEQMEPGSAAYNIPTAFLIDGLLDVNVLQKALAEIVRRHEILRTTFHVREGRPYQSVSKAADFELPMIDLASLTEHEANAGIANLAAENATHVFDLTQGPLFRAQIVRLTATRHALLLCLHHIISDGWSLNVLFQELAVLFEAFSKGQASPLKELSVQYADFAIWQREWLQGEVLENQLRYWRSQLPEVQPDLALRPDHFRRRSRTARTRRHSVVLDSSFRGELYALARSADVTPFILLLAAFKVLLFRYSGQESIVLGSPIANRNRSDIEPLIGFFVNTLVLRTETGGNPSFQGFLARVKETAMGAYAHQDLPFELLVETLQPARTPDRSPLFQIMFSFRNEREASLQLHNLNVSTLPVDEGHAAKFDLMLGIVETASGLRVTFHYNTDLFEADTIDRLGSHFQTLLRAIVADPSRPVESLEMLSRAERQRMLVEWNETKTTYPSRAALHELFELQAEKTPYAVALDFEGKSWTYRELNERANQVAHFLRRTGIDPESMIGVCLERSAELILALLAILKAGGAYVPLDPSYPADRLQFMLADSGLRFLITSEEMLDRFPGKSQMALCVDRDAELISGESRTNPNAITNGDSAAYVMYTSGSTGKPKGVIIPQKAISRLVINTDYAQVTPADVVGQVSNASFDAMTFEVWGALLNGARLAVVSTEVLLSPKEFAAEIGRREINTLFMTTALFNQLAREVPTAFRNLRTLLTGGEACDPVSMQMVLRSGAPARLINIYGPTETTTFAAWHRVEEIADTAALVPIGRPIRNAQLYILDRNGEPVPVGVTGELYIGGDGLARGYLNRPELTARSFIANKFDSTPDSRLYKSGDRARFRADGTIEILGRFDQQIKLRGFRIEPGEIEETLKLDPAVKDAVVLPFEDVGGNKRLVAYIVASEEPAPTVESLRQWTAGRLPSYMIPSGFVFVSAIPLTANGKTDRLALMRIDVRPNADAHVRIAPRDDLEAQLVRIWEQALNVKPVGIRDNFFDAGGHSLLAVRVLSEIERVTGKRLSLSDFFHAPTVEENARLLRPQKRALNYGRLVPVQNQGSRPPLFLLQGTVEIGRQMGADQPFYTCLPHGEDGLPVPPTVSEIADDYLREIRKVQPHGPYLLGGFSFTGLVAIEIAQKLKRQGEHVALLVLVDPTTSWSRSASPTVPTRPPRAPSGSFMSSISRQVQEIGFRPVALVSSIWKGLQWRIEGHTRRFTTPMKWELCRAFLPVWSRLPFKPYPLRKFYFLQASLRVARKYEPEPYDGEVILFLSEELSGRETAWRQKVTGTLRVHKLPGDHTEMVREPNASTLAAVLRGYLAGGRSNPARPAQISHLT